MGGEIKWEAIGLVAEMFGVEDIETFVAEMVAIRTFTQAEAGAYGDS